MQEGQPTESSVTPGQVPLGFIRNVTDYEPRRKPVNRNSPGSLLQSLCPAPVSYIKPVLSQVALGRGIYHSNRNHARTVSKQYISYLPLTEMHSFLSALSHAGKNVPQGFSSNRDIAALNHRHAYPLCLMLCRFNRWLHKLELPLFKRGVLDRFFRSTRQQAKII